MTGLSGRRFAPLGVAVLVLLVLGAGWSLLRVAGPAGDGVGGPGTREPPVIALTGWQAAASGPADPRFRLADGADLPDGPRSATVRQLVAGDVGPLRAALRARAADRGRSLTVEESGHWSLGATGCAVAQPAPPSGVRVPSGSAGYRSTLTMVGDCAPPDPGTHAAGDPRAVAAPVLEALGLADAEMDVAPDGGAATVVARPVVAGLPTAGMATRLWVSDGAVRSGEGWAVTTSAGPEYPVMGAREAYDRLVRTPRPTPLMACPEPLPPDADRLVCGGPVTVTGARMGLSPVASVDGWLLLPTWLFAVRDSPEPLTQPAVQPRFLRPARGTGTPPTAGTGTPRSAGPGEPVPDPASRFTSVRRGADDRTLVVRFWGGVRECYSYDVRVAEDARRVRLFLVENRVAGDRPCIEIAEARRIAVPLDEPLARRTVEDGDSGRVLLAPAG